MKRRKRRPTRKGSKLRGRERRLALAPDWVGTYEGKRSRMVNRYRKTFQVDWECAIAELAELGVEHDTIRLAELRETVSGKRRDHPRQAPLTRWEFDAYHEVEPTCDEHFAYIAGYTSGGFPYGISWEEWASEEEGQPLEDDSDSEPPR